MRNVDLSRFRDRVTVGAEGDIKISGDGVAARHAEVRAAGDGSDWIRAIEGEVWLRRKGLRELVIRPRRLADGDVIVIGPEEIRYVHLGRGRARNTERRATWMR